MIAAIDLCKRYEDGVLALDNLNLSVSPGEIYCLLGANGAGKTTTINIFLNFVLPSSGHALLHGIDVAKEPLAAKRHVAYLSENVMLYGNFTARQNLDFFARLAGCKALGRDAGTAVMREVGLPEKAFDQPVRDFSKGMRQKLGIAIAMVKDAPALLLDEPMSGLDPKAATELVRTLCDLRARGKAILMSTHDVFRAKELADRVGIMRGGRKVLDRSRADLAHEDLERLYLETMQTGTEAERSSAHVVA